MYRNQDEFTDGLERSHFQLYLFDQAPYSYTADKPMKSQQKPFDPTWYLPTSSKTVDSRGNVKS